MGLRYPFLALVNLLAGGFLVAATYGFSPGTAVTLGFAVSIGVALVGATMAFSGLERKAPGLAVLGLLTGVLAAWTVVATTGIFADDVARWLVFGSALGHIGISVAGISLHEIGTERVVHHLEVRDREPAHS